MPQIVKAFEQLLIDTKTAYQWEDDELVFHHEFRGNTFMFSLIQNGDDDLQVMVGWEAGVPTDEFKALEVLLKQMAGAGFILGEVFGDDEHGYLINRIHFHTDEQLLAPGAVSRMMLQMLTPFSEAIDRILQVMVGIYTPQKAIASFAIWSRRNLRRGDEFMTWRDDRRLFD